ALVWRGRGRRGPCGTSPAPLEASGQVGLALWSFVASTAHGSGMMLVPALVPLCLGDAPAGEITASGSLMLALAAVAVHALAMIGTLGLIAVGTVRGCAWVRHWGPGRRRVAQTRVVADPVAPDAGRAPGGAPQ
ncbi:hypothetical protein, partial [Thermomonas sp.]|uniref:hypothetical protein n=1 Tax=Thermomonas sp. TaxID=1971895 RepID=UPI0035B0E58E